MVALFAIFSCIALASCSGWQSSLHAQGPDAERVLQLFWFFVVVSGIVWVLVVIGLARAITRRVAVSAQTDPLAVDPAQERYSALVVAALTAITLVVLSVFTVLSYLGSRGLAAGERHAVEIEVTGYQWWWEIRYLDPKPSRVFATANEIRIPAGRPVKATLLAGDVIHSFWVPNLVGKKDLIPGQRNELTFTADRPGTFRGQCAEFCGLQHAHMALRVIALSGEEFDAWRDAQVKPAASAATPLAHAGQNIFEKRACVLCHAVRGTIAGGRLGPDLTHFASRATIAAGTLPNTPENLARWIAEPQSVKPGTRMPRVSLTGEEVDALVAYLEALR